MIDQKLIPSRLIPLGEIPPVVVTRPSKPSRFILVYAVELCRFCIALLWLLVRNKLTRQAHALQVRLSLERLGGLWIKLGQLLSLRTDIFSHEFCHELSGLQTRAEGFPAEFARRIIEEELGAPLETFFDDFEPIPFAAASIGQVHRARLRREDRLVAIKVQRPYASETFLREMSFIRLLAWFLEKLWFIPNLQWQEMLWELNQILAEEIDYRVEATSHMRMRKTLRAHKIHVHKVFYAYSTRRLLVTEYVTGVLMADYIRVKQADPARCDRWQEENNVEPRKVARRLFESLWRQLLEDNLFHADLHPGNIILLRDSRVALIDFGAVGSMEREYQMKYFMMMKGMATKDYAKVADCLFLISGALPPTDLTEVKKQLIRFLRGWEVRSYTRGLPYHERSMSALANGLIRILFRFECPADWAFLRITRAQETVDQSLMHLYPEANYGKLMTWYFRRIQERRRKRAFTSGHLRDFIDDIISGMRLPLHWAENATFEGWILRRRAQAFQGGTSKVAQLLAVLAGRGTVLVGMALVYFLLVFAHQHYSGWSPLVARWMGEELEAFPRITYFSWVLILMIGLNLFVTLWKLKHTFARKERAPLHSP